MRRAVVALVVVLVAATAACGDGSPSGSGASPTDGGGASGEASPPTVTVPDGPPPTELQVRDLVVGTGAEAATGKTVAVHYVGVLWSTREQFDSSWDRGQPLPFTLGEGRVIQGWEQGILGMRVGGRRELVIPPDLAYGPEGYPGTIGPNETLVFVVDLVAVQ